MTSPWQPERTVDPAEAREMIGAQFPELHPARVESFALASWDNTTYLVNESFVFRFPRRQVAAHLIDYEARILPHLSLLVPLPVPEPRWIGRPTQNYPWSFAGYRILGGATACSLALSNAERSVLAAPLGRFLRDLHSVPSAKAKSWGAPLDEIRRLDIDHRNPATVDRLHQLERDGTIEDAKPLLRILDEGRALRPSQPFVLLHGDLYSRHLLVLKGAGHGPETSGSPGCTVESPTLSGIIDWGDVHLGLPSVDLAVAHVFLPAESHAAFRAAYGVIDDEAWELARLRAIWHSAAVAQFAATVGDADLSREAQFSFQNVLPE